MLCPAALSALVAFGEWHTMHAAKPGQGSGAARTYELAWIACLACPPASYVFVEANCAQLRRQPGDVQEVPEAWR
jgi:hypothetical protein